MNAGQCIFNLTRNWNLYNTHEGEVRRHKDISICNVCTHHSVCPRTHVTIKWVLLINRYCIVCMTDGGSRSPSWRHKHMWQLFYLFHVSSNACTSSTNTNINTTISRGHTNMTSGRRCPWVSKIPAELPPSTCQPDKCMCAFVFPWR